MSDTILGIAFLLFGLYGIGVGIYLFVAPGAEERINRGYVFRTGLVPSRGLFGAIPVGIATACVGLATIFEHTSMYDVFMAMAVAFGFLGTFAIVWAPNWIRPKWARSHKK
jgi:hypothetical protein